MDDSLNNLRERVGILVWEKCIFLVFSPAVDVFAAGFPKFCFPVTLLI
jgi:hypothetical protein